MSEPQAERIAAALERIAAALEALVDRTDPGASQPDVQDAPALPPVFGRTP